MTIDSSSFYSVPAKCLKMLGACRTSGGAFSYSLQMRAVRRLRMCCSTRCFFRCGAFILFLTLAPSLLLHWAGIYIVITPDDMIQFGGEGQDEPVGVLVDDNMTINRYKKVFLPAEEDMPHPIVIWWTPFTGYRRRVRECDRGSCLFTHSRTEQHNPKTAAFMYYGSDLNWNDLPLPRDPNVFWALLHEESPKNNWLFAHEDAISLFNLTATCSRSSSYPLTTQYLYSLENISAPVKVPTREKSRGQGLGLVSFLQSDCNPPSDRDTYVSELMKHVSVDSYGRCLHNKDLPKHLLDTLTFGTQDVADIVAKYKFSIAMENAICFDYITEKFWRPLQAGSVPIVRGSPSIKDWAPDIKSSIIVASDFSSPKELAEYLLYLDSHDDEYEKLLSWKRTGITNQRLVQHMKEREWYINRWDKLNFIDGFECYVCDRIHERQQKTAKRRPLDPIIANSDHYSCPPRARV